MREALEQVRQELGEEALVIDSRRVRAGELLGNPRSIAVAT